MPLICPPNVHVPQPKRTPIANHHVRIHDSKHRTNSKHELSHDAGIFYLRTVEKLPGLSPLVEGGRKRCADERRNGWVEEKEARGSDDYPKFIGPLHEHREPPKPRIRNIQAKLFRSRDSFSPSASMRRFLLFARARARVRSLCLIVNTARGLWGASVTTRRSSKTIHLVLRPLAPPSSSRPSPYDRRLREHCVTDGIIPAPFSTPGGEGVT